MSILCEAHITRALRDSNDRYVGKAVRNKTIRPRQLSAAAVLRELADVRAVPVTIESQLIWVRTDINGHVAKLFQSLGLRLPPKLLGQKAAVAQPLNEPATDCNN